MAKKLLLTAAIGALAVAQYRFGFVEPLIERSSSCLLLNESVVCTSQDLKSKMSKVLRMFREDVSLPPLLVYRIDTPKRKGLKGEYSRNRVVVVSHPNPNEEESTLLHELLHAYFFNNMSLAERKQVHEIVESVLSMFTLETPTTLNDFVSDEKFMEDLKKNLQENGFSENETDSVMRAVLFAGTYGRRCTHSELDNYPSMLDSSEIFSFMAEEGIHPVFKHFYPLKEDYLRKRIEKRGLRRSDLPVLRAVNTDTLTRIIWETIDKNRKSRL